MSYKHPPKKTNTIKQDHKQNTITTGQQQNNEHKIKKIQTNQTKTLFFVFQIKQTRKFISSNLSFEFAFNFDKKHIKNTKINSKQNVYLF